MGVLIELRSLVKQIRHRRHQTHVPVRHQSAPTSWQVRAVAVCGRQTDRQTDRSLSSPATPSLPPCWRVGEPEIADKTCSNYLGGKGGRRKKNNKKQKRKK